MVTTHKDANMRCCRALDMIDRSSPDQEEQKISKRDEDGKGLYVWFSCSTEREAKKSDATAARALNLLHRQRRPLNARHHVG